MKTPRAKAQGFMLMKMIILRFAPGAIHPQAEAWGLLAFSIKISIFVAEGQNFDFITDYLHQLFPVDEIHDDGEGAPDANGRRRSDADQSEAMAKKIVKINYAAYELLYHGLYRKNNDRASFEDFDGEIVKRLLNTKT